MTSRIGFWLWYIVPLTAVLSGQPALGLAIYGLYGAARGVAVWGLLVWLSRDRRHTRSALWLLTDGATIARRLAAGQLIVVGLAVAIVIGI